MSFTVASEGNGMEYFYTMAGEGELLEIDDSEKESTSDAKVLTIDKVVIDGENNCQGLSLVSNNHPIVGFAVCESGSHFICPGGLDNCIQEFSKPTEKISENSWEMPSRLANAKYVVTFYSDSLIYEIKKKNCLIPYPHGCLIDGFGWSSKLTYKFFKKMKIKNRDKS